ncbi:MAG: hypothetical protein GWN82_10075, partial [Gemmatimonadetes bacterium]|nr:hypothetical protein [Gemmatimonadota bacterium]NIT87202.1 hypothetical protein [Gemmatimonadota bacterium]NIU31039.1 hypothetical protein [Gemmatimonadota bacterium]NIV61402.1 hypothetical protein [Gemmatimonadota bacterium]NIW64106.1 hypothetical protein [Gemmatimonadota bacterium]
MNNRLEWRGALRSAVIELLGILPDAAFDDGGEAAVFAEGVRESLEEVLEAKSGKSVRENPRLAVEREMERIEREETRTGREGKHLDALSEERREACALLFSLIDQVAGLRGRKQVRVVGIGPLDEEGRPLNLAGDFVANFGGFFKEEYRTYDFEVGRALAGRMLEGAGLLDEEARLEELPEKPDSDPTAASTPQAERLLERIKEVAGDFLDVRMDWPLKLDKLAIRLGKAKLGRMIAGALGEDEEPVFPYVVRLKITPAEPE